MELSTVGEEPETNRSKSDDLYENLKVESVILTVSQTVQEAGDDLEHYEPLRLDTKPDTKGDRPENKSEKSEIRDTLNRLKCVIFVMSGMMIMLYIAVIVLVIIIAFPKAQIDGKWAQWSDWTSCDVTCGNGTQLRTRSCSDPAPIHGGAGCIGESAQINNCTKSSCQVTDGGWTNWEGWSACTLTCRGGIQSRSRSCTNPKPSDHGEYCTGDTLQIQQCNLNKCSPNGKWAQWSDWTSCDVTCGNGTQLRTRSCSDPAPIHGGADCIGETAQINNCTKSSCQASGKWAQWSDWTSCDITCGNGTQLRTRSCSDPATIHGGGDCIGESAQINNCTKSACKVTDGGWTNWEGWSACTLTCGGGIQSRSRSCTNPKPSDRGEYCTGDTLQIQPCNLNKCSPIASAFSVDQPSSYISIDGVSRLTFSHTIYQHGDDFNSSAGIYNCSIPGTYYFFVTLVKKRSASRVDLVACYIYKNEAGLIRIKIDPTDDDTDKGSAAISQSVLIHLNKGDTVYLSSCSSPPSTYMENWTSFTGFLLYPE